MKKLELKVVRPEDLKKRDDYLFITKGGQWETGSYGTECFGQEHEHIYVDEFGPTFLEDILLIFRLPEPSEMDLIRDGEYSWVVKS